MGSAIMMEAMRAEVMKARKRGNGFAGLLLAFSFLTAHAATWFPLGPYGGDARSFGSDPNDPRHVFLGTTTGWIYDSRDGGATWARVAHLGTHDNLVIRHILVDPAKPKRLIVGAWMIDRPDGGVFISEDGGKTWYAQAQMRGQSVRSMARSATDPNEIAAGTLQGVFLSRDGGMHWQQISPLGSTELHEVESLAIDPADPNVIYAGTWHLPWKTTDGGATWSNITQGIIDDSDVFSIIVDPTHPETVYASACSGIYKSQNAGEKFQKVQGIPSTARRTRRLLQDPTAPDTVFAGTTEGLYRTKDGGGSFTRTTGGDVIINDVYVDPSHPEHVLLATDRGGVLSSDDGGDTFQPSNSGFSARQVLAYAADPENPGTIYVGVVNDKATGGVFQSRDGGVQWAQQSDGLGGLDVFSLASTTSGTLLAGTSHGVYRLETGAWMNSSAMEALSSSIPSPDGSASGSAPAGAVSQEPPHQPAAQLHGPASPKPPIRRKNKRTIVPAKATARKGHAGLHAVSAKKNVRRAPAPQRERATGRKPPVTVAVTKVISAPNPSMDAIVYGMLTLPDAVYAATSAGLMRSGNDGRQWSAVSSLAMPEVRFVAGEKSLVLAGGLRRLALSNDAGATWDSLPLPADVTQLSAMAVDELGNLWVGGAEGVYYSTDYGLTWKTLRNLFTTLVDSIFFDAANHRVLVTTSNSTVTFAAHLPDYKVSFWDTGWHLRFVRPVGDHLIGATLYDGMVLQPRMVAPAGTPADSVKAPTAAPPAAAQP